MKNLFQGDRDRRGASDRVRRIKNEPRGTAPFALRPTKKNHASATRSTVNAAFANRLLKRMML